MLEDEPVRQEELWLIKPTLLLHSEFVAMIGEYQRQGETISFHQSALADFPAYLKRWRIWPTTSMCQMGSY
jgi:hypothetical protein